MTLVQLGKRTSFLFSPLASQQLADLKFRTRLSTLTDVLGTALIILAETIEFVTSGGHIFIKSRKTNKLWAYSPFSPPRDYPNFSPTWSTFEEAEKTERHSFTFSPAMLEQVQNIQRSSRLQSLSDVVRAAIAVLNELLSAQEADDQIIFRNKHGASRRYIPLGGAGAGSEQPAKVYAIADSQRRQAPRDAGVAEVAGRRGRTTQASR